VRPSNAVTQSEHHHGCAPSTLDDIKHVRKWTVEPAAQFCARLSRALRPPVAVQARQGSEYSLGSGRRQLRDIALTWRRKADRTAIHQFALQRVERTGVRLARVATT
jgi:hypothetical protein